MDLVEPTQQEDPAAMLTTLKSMVSDQDYHPRNQTTRATKTREEKYREIVEILDGLEYWQFRFRLWLAHKYHYIREEVAFLFGFTWGVLRPMAFELGQRLVDTGTLNDPSHVYFLVTEELGDAIASRAKSVSKA